ncbi:hypothetical protein B0H14DRAFT_2571914 [Mycena olivaceomarginata]|nr:hypothetical protein B0H14DRAFT_2571914 [Mycena olivaceomarginata]
MGATIVPNKALAYKTFAGRCSTRCPGSSLHHRQSPWSVGMELETDLRPPQIWLVVQTRLREMSGPHAAQAKSLLATAATHAPQSPAAASTGAGRVLPGQSVYAPQPSPSSGARGRTRRGMDYGEQDKSNIAKRAYPAHWNIS